MKSKFEITSPIKPNDKVTAVVNDFLSNFTPLELNNGGKALLLYDEKSKAYYLPCHLKSADFCDFTDFDATIDGSDEEDLYKLNRDITENESAFNTMSMDAKAGRTFEDIVVEYDKGYKSERPLKIYGGQHRIKAIESARNLKGDTHHGFRVYFGLTKDQKVEIATINNTSITVSNDLLDRMKEQLLGTELREFCQKVGLIEANQDFSDKKDSVIPTVRVARTFIVNYLKGRDATSTDFHIPIVCKSGGSDDEYMKARSNINWVDNDLLEAGRQFAILHKTQRAKVTGRKADYYSQFASKALSLAVVASWSYASGYYSKNSDGLKILYSLVDNLGTSDDHLNAKALSEARFKGTDPDTYRGLGTRNSPDELGRMLEVFIVLVEKATEKKITKNLANAAIQSYEAKKATNNANKAFSKI
jgi:hypothetical protein